MAVTTKQLAARAEGIGSSDAAAILGFSPWSSPADIRLQKLGLLEDQPASELAEIGTHLEDGIASIAEKRLGVRLVKPKGTFIHPEHDCLRANVDRQVGKFGRGQPIVELKDSGIDDAWGEPGTDQVPPYVLCQIAHQMLCSDAPGAHVARLGRGFKRGLFIFEITLTDDVRRLMDAMVQFLPIWWARYVDLQEPLPETDRPPSLDILKRVRREPDTTTILDDGLVLSWRQAEEEYKAAETARDEAKARVLDALGDNEAGLCAHGSVTYFAQTRHTIDAARLKAERPEIAELYSAASTHRVCRYKPAK